MSVDVVGRTPAAMAQITLSSDELEFLTTIKGTDGLSELAKSIEHSSTVLEPAQIREAVTDLEQSTSSLEKLLLVLESNTKQLAIACQAAQSCNTRRSESGQSNRASLVEQRARLQQLIEYERADIEQRNIINKASLEKLLSSSYACVDGQELDESSNSTSGLHVGVKPYNGLLDKLQALGGEIKYDAGSETFAHDARFYASVEVWLSVSACRSLLNQQFRDVATSYLPVSGSDISSHHMSAAEMVAIKEEVQSLWEEVVPVAHMAVEKVSLEPILKAIEAQDFSHQTQNTIIASYINKCLDFMNERLQILAMRLDSAIQHHHVVGHARQQCELMSSISQTEPSLVLGQAQRKHPSISTRQIREGEGSTALICVQQAANKLGGVSGEPIDYSLPISANITRLNDLIQQRARKNEESLSTHQQSYESRARAFLDDKQRASATVHDCLLADSLVEHGNSGSVLLDGMTEESLQALQSESNTIDSMLLRMTGNEMNFILKSMNLPALDMSSGSILPLSQRYSKFAKDHPESSTIEPIWSTKATQEIIQRWSDRAGPK